MNLDQFPRVQLSHLPTPLEFMPNLTKHLGGPNIWIKRDDCTGIALGGSKNRKLEFLMGDALKNGADHIVTLGAVQSNHVRQTAAVAARMGLRFTAILEHRYPHANDEYLHNGNLLLNQLLGAEILYRPGGTDMNASLADVGIELSMQGRTPYLIPAGGSNPVGSLGYVIAAQELLNQSREKSLQINHIVHATGSAGTQAGLVVGMALEKYSTAIQGFAVSQPAVIQHSRVLALAQATADLIGLEVNIAPEVVRVNADYLGDGYSFPTDEMVEAVKLIARKEGILLDPVYTGKAMAGLISLIEQGFYLKDENIVFIHTGGQAGLFGFCQTFKEE